MQKLQSKLKNVPMDTSPVHSSTNPVLNKEILNGSLSVQDNGSYDHKLSCNNSEVNQHQHRGDSTFKKAQSMVYVLDKKGEPLMPTTAGKARRLLTQGKAKVVKRFPFVIQLLVLSGKPREKIVLGVDSGYLHIGLSALSPKKEVFSADIRLRGDVVSLMSEKRMYRRGRRNRHHWYRPPRFNNRKRKETWFVPSIKNKMDSHIEVIKRVCKILPVSKIIIEVANFDIQQIKDPSVEGVKYQQGVQYGFQNVRHYVFYRDNYQCQICEKKDIPLSVHHIESRMVGGDSPDNLITLCCKCHKNYHKGKVKLKIKRGKSFKPETFMSTVKLRMLNKLQEFSDNIETTYGYITKEKRRVLQIEKSHINDAFCIADGILQERSMSYEIIKKRRNNRCLQINRKGFKPSIRKKRYAIRPGDLITVNGKEIETKGIHGYGKYVRVKIDGKVESISTKLITKHYYFNGWQFVLDSNTLSK